MQQAWVSYLAREPVQESTLKDLASRLTPAVSKYGAMSAVISAKVREQGSEEQARCLCARACEAAIALEPTDTHQLSTNKTRLHSLPVDCGKRSTVVFLTSCVEALLPTKQQISFKAQTDSKTTWSKQL